MYSYRLVLLFMPVIIFIPLSAWQAFANNYESDCDLTKQPVLLVRGGDGPEDLADAVEGLAHLYRWMQQDGYVEDCNLFYASEVSAYKSREANRMIVQQELRDAYDRLIEINPMWQGGFDIIGHSFGGLIARYYLESPYYEADRAYGTNGIRVDNLFTLGTPHGGTRVPEELYPGAMLVAGEPIFSSQDFEQFLAVAQLYASAMDVYNATHWQPSDVRYHLVAGDFLQQQDVPPAIRLLYAPYASVPGDIAVSRRSAAQLGLNQDLREFYPQTCLYFTGDMHGYTDSFGLGELNSYLHPSDTYLNVIREQLGSRELGCPLRKNWSYLPMLFGSS